MLIYSGVGRCRSIFSKKLNSRVIFLPIFAFCASLGVLGGAVTWSADAWPGTYAASAGGGAGVADNNTVVLGVFAWHLLNLVW